MLIKTKITEKDFVKANMTLLFRRTSTKVFTAIGIIFLLYSFYNVIWLEMDWSPIVLGASFLTIFGSPILTWLLSKRNYKASKRATETIEYQFEKDDLVVNGESFTSRLSWDKLYKVTQTKEFLLIWQTRASANFIPKRDIWPGDIIELKEILDSHNVKNTL